MGDNLLLIRVVGRRSGRRLEIVAGRHELDGRPATFTNSIWRLNFRGGRDCEVVLGGVEHHAHADLIEDPERVAGVYGALIDRLGNRDAQRRLGIRINVDRRPTDEELAAAVRSSGLSIASFDLRDCAPAK